MQYFFRCVYVSIHSRPRRGGRSQKNPRQSGGGVFQSTPAREGAGDKCKVISKKSYRWFQSTPAREGAGDEDRTYTIQREGGFNPLPPAKGREIAPRWPARCSFTVSIHSRPRRGGRSRSAGCVTRQSRCFNPLPPAKGREIQAKGRPGSGDRGFNPLPPAKGREIR